MKSLKYRRQFALFNKDITVDKTWKSFTFHSRNSEWFLNYHPDLGFLSKSNDRHGIILLGYMLDPHSPAYKNEEIIENLLSLKGLSEILESSCKCNGRYVIIYYTRDEICVFHDATGFREVYYHFDGELAACGSTPNIIADCLEINKTKDYEILKFFNSDEYKDHDYTWIGYKTLFENVLHLPPNYYLHMQSRHIKRYWPVRKLHKIDIDTCSRACAEILKGTIASAINRFELHMGITAGWDTRLLLAASKEYRESIYYYVNKPKALANNHRDIRIPRQLAAKLDFTLNIIDIPIHVSKEFEKDFYQNNILANDKLLNIFYNVYLNNWEHTATVSGAMGNGLARVYMPLPDDIKITGTNLSILVGYSKFQYAISELEQWCNEIVPVCKDYNINIMDLYQMEQENANWASLTASEQDIVREEIRPFNNRQLIELFWSLEDKYRYQYYPLVYIKAMEILWNKVLKIPINPSKKSTIYKALRVLGIEQRVYYLYKRINLMRDIRSFPKQQ